MNLGTRDWLAFSPFHRRPGKADVAVSVAAGVSGDACQGEYIEPGKERLGCAILVPEPASLAP
jgi:hypothetical protein